MTLSAIVLCGAIGLAFFTLAIPQVRVQPNPMALINHRVDRTNMVVGSHCSGTYISAVHSLVLTNAHCLEKKHRDAGEIEVSQGIYYDHVKVGATVWTVDIVAVNDDKDLALLQFRVGYVPHHEPTPLLPTYGRIERGERIYIVGNPAMLEASITEGVVSSVTRNFTELKTDAAPRALVQISGGLFSGNSGGALYNAQGYLIGVPTIGRRDAWHIGFAVPSSLIHQFLAESCFVPNPEPCRRKADLERVTVVPKDAPKPSKRNPGDPMDGE